MRPLNMIVVLVSLVALTSCGKKSKSDAGCYNVPMEALDGRDAMLVVGDSISIGYTPKVKTEFPAMQVIHNTCNARNTRHGLANIQTWAAHAPRWKVCTINHGLWDISQGWEVPLAEYLQNLEDEVNVLKAVCDDVMFITTTHVPVNASKFNRAVLAQYNADATALMGVLNVPVCDLNAVSNTITNLHINAGAQNDVHYVGAGYAVLGTEVANCVRAL